LTVEGASRQALSHARSVLDELTATPVGTGTPAGGSTAAAAGPSVGGRLADDLAAVAAVLRRELAVRRALTDPGSPAASRVALAERLFAGQVGEPALTVLKQAVAERWSRDVDLVLGLAELVVEALLAQAEASAALDEVEDELFRFSRILGQNPQLSLALTDPASPESAKSALLERLLAGRAHPVTVQLVERAVADREHGDLERKLEEYSWVAAARRNRVVAVVRTAVPLDDGQAARLRAAISRHFGREIQLQIDVDPTVIGGVVVRVGDEIVDGSVLRRLNAARRRLVR
jgi:F-type H+-transporting ATPase subunit delta